MLMLGNLVRVANGLAEDEGWKVMVEEDKARRVRSGKVLGQAGAGVVLPQAHGAQKVSRVKCHGGTLHLLAVEVWRAMTLLVAAMTGGPSARVGTVAGASMQTGWRGEALDGGRKCGADADPGPVGVVGGGGVLRRSRARGAKGRIGEMGGTPMASARHRLAKATSMWRCHARKW